MRLFLLALPVAVAAALSAATPDFAGAQKLYQNTDYRAAVRLMEAAAEKDAAAWALLGRCYYQLGDYKKATGALEKAVAAAPSSSEYHHWLGRAFGRRAETSSPLTAPMYASKTRQFFEKAVALDPGSKEPINDIFEYYLEAPGFLGGGFDKAAALANRIAALDPVEGHYAQYRLAEKRKDYKGAEQQLRRAAQLAPRQVGRVIDLAKFLARHGRVQESEQAFAQAREIAPDEPKLLFHQADAYVQSRTNLEKARALLKQYLASPLSPDDPPPAEARKLLQQAGA